MSHQKTSLTAQDWAMFIGCKFLAPKEDSIYELKGVTQDAGWSNGILLQTNMWGFIKADDCTPILRSIYSIHKSEIATPHLHDCISAVNTIGNEHFTNKIALIAKTLIDHHFDIFNWIDANLAIDADSLETNPYNT